ncbi:hypothetical protein EPI10_001482 [Gossypium australe]|uniref:Uncharacterized protein n=1 Tax=Gossypium australe TaxID=47621 RepID=A0A5B6VB75_9ROSI|nr:hypothetical protein EPI10_001482 [Gossypium australe]
MGSSTNVNYVESTKKLVRDSLLSWFGRILLEVCGWIFMSSCTNDEIATKRRTIYVECTVSGEF